MSSIHVDHIMSLSQTIRMWHGEMGNSGTVVHRRNRAAVQCRSRAPTRPTPPA